MLQKVKECYKSVEVPFAKEDRYQSRRQNQNGVTGEKFRKESKIHGSEVQVMQNAKTILRFKNGKKKPGRKTFSVSVDLTKRRYELVSETNEFIKNNDLTSFFSFNDFKFNVLLLNCILLFSYVIFSDSLYYSQVIDDKTFRFSTSPCYFIPF